jgi:hypothetical protein
VGKELQNEKRPMNFFQKSQICLELGSITKQNLLQSQGITKITSFLQKEIKVIFSICLIKSFPFLPLQKISYKI